MTTLLIIVHLFVCLVLIGVVLLQSGRAGGMGVLSGAATQTVFGGRGAGSFLQKLTAVCAILFMLTCSSLAYLASSTRDRGLTATASTPASTAPAHPAAPPPASAPASAPVPANAPVETAPAAPAAPVAPVVPGAPAAPAVPTAPSAPAAPAPAEPAAH